MVQSHKIPKIPVTTIEHFLADLRAKLKAAPEHKREAVYADEYVKIGREFVLKADSVKPMEQIQLALKHVRRDFDLDKSE